MTRSVELHQSVTLHHALLLIVILDALGITHKVVSPSLPWVVHMFANQCNVMT